MRRKIKKNNFDFKKREGSLVRIFVIAFLLYIIFIIIADVRKILSIGAVFHWRVIPIVLFFILMNYLLRTVRFHYLLKKINICFDFATSLSIFFSGIATTVTPGKMGEVVKSYLIKKKSGHGYIKTIPLLFFERVIDGVAMIILSLGGVYLFPARAVILFFLFSTGLVAIFFMLVSYRRPAFFIIRLIEKRFHLNLSQRVIDFFDHARSLTHWKIISVSLSLSLAAWALQGISLYILVQPFIASTQKISLIQGVLYAFFIFSFSSIAAFFALIPAGIGVAEGSLISFLSLFFRITFTQAVFISLIFRFTSLWFGVGAGLLFLVKGLRAKNHQDKK